MQFLCHSCVPFWFQNVFKRHNIPTLNIYNIWFGNINLNILPFIYNIPPVSVPFYTIYYTLCTPKRTYCSWIMYVSPSKYLITELKIYCLWIFCPNFVHIFRFQFFFFFVFFRNFCGKKTCTCTYIMYGAIDAPFSTI